MTDIQAGVIVPDWPAPPAVHAAVTTRRLAGHSAPPYDACNLGLNSGESAATVLANRDFVRERLGLPAMPVWLRQVHGTAVHVARIADRAGSPPEADAAYTDEPGVVLAILTADCLPLLAASDDGREVAAIHAGWRGLCAGAIEAAIAHFRAPPDRLLVWLGPAIGAVSYEVGDEVRTAFQSHDPAAIQAFEPTRPGHWHCDLYRLARQRLARLGVMRVSGGGFDTCADPRFYSFRRDAAASGRFASLIWRD